MLFKEEMLLKLTVFIIAKMVINLCFVFRMVQVSKGRDILCDRLL